MYIFHNQVLSLNCNVSPSTTVKLLGPKILLNDCLYGAVMGVKDLSNYIFISCVVGGLEVLMSTKFLSFIAKIVYITNSLNKA